MTSSLFATTVLASFFVVALPHVLPCPVPATRYADGDVLIDENGRRKVWRRRDAVEPEVKDGIVHFGAADTTMTSTGAMRRGCPLPKPGGMLGEWLGFHKADDANNRADR